MIKDSIRLNLEPNYVSEEFDLSNLNFTWDVVSFEEDLLTIKISFIKPFYISSQNIQDQLVIKFENLTNF